MKKILLGITLLLPACVTEGYESPQYSHQSAINGCTEAAQYSALSGGSQSVDDCMRAYNGQPAPPPTVTKTKCKPGPYGTVECTTISQ